MKQEVADTPGRFAMASVQVISVENSLFRKIDEKEGYHGKTKN